MSETLIDDVQSMLNEEKFTRATIGSYSIAQFKKLEGILREASEQRATAALKNCCEEHLAHSKNSIIALYFSGMLALSSQLIDDSALVNLVTIFVDNRKWDIVKYLCERILEGGESKFALRTLADCYKNDNQEDQMYAVWERLVKVDYEEADIAKALADRFEKQGDLDKAVDYYRKALHRSINKQIFTNVREIWQKLLEYHGEDVDFFLSTQRKVGKNISEEKAIQLLEDVYAMCMKKNDIDTALVTLKLILDYDERDNTARKEITECFRKKYAKHSQLEEYIRISNLAQGYRNVHEAITDFEKHIAFDKGNFVYHRTWGVGRIQKVEGDDIIIDFTKKRGHSMSLKMAIDALQTLSKTHIWVLKATKKKEELHDKVKQDPEWALRTIIRSFNNTCDLKHIKAELVPQILTTGEWLSWSNKAKGILAHDTAFGVSPDNIDVFTVRDRKISIQEKLFNEFRAEKKFFNKVDILRKYMDTEDFDLDSEYFSEMFAYFNAYVKSYTQVSEMVVASYLLVKEIAARFPALSTNISFNFVEMFEKIEDVSALFINLKDNELRGEFLKQIKFFIPNWPDVYVKLFTHAQLPILLDNLRENGHEDKLVSMTAACFDNYRDREARDTAVWLYKNYRSSPWFQRTAFTEEKELITLIYILDATYRDIENHRDTPENKKTNKQVHALLFKDGLLDTYISNEAHGRDMITRISTLVEDVKGLDPADKLNIRSKIQDRFPDFKFSGAVLSQQVSRGLIVTAAKYEEKQKQLAHIMEEEVPANSKEIAFALSLGDLRENAEYKAAKEKQEILNSTVAKLKDEIDRAQLYDPRSVNTSRVSFGTVVTLERTDAAGKVKTESYTILGPWESDPDRKIISYLSPFGNALQGKKAGEQFSFAVGDEKVAYTVTKIDEAVLA